MNRFFHIVNPFQLIRIHRKAQREQYKAPPSSLHGLRVEWVPAERCRKHLREVCQQWYQPNHESLLEELNLIRWQVIGGDQRIQPYPTVVSISSNDVVVGALSGRPNYVHRHFFIEQIAVHPGYAFHPESSLIVVNALLEAAIDYSLELEFNGWVACDTEIKYLDLLKHNGFHPYDPFTYRRMGYFA